jgi:hypothetical protein
LYYQVLLKLAVKKEKQNVISRESCFKNLNSVHNQPAF